MKKSHLLNCIDQIDSHLLLASEGRSEHFAHARKTAWIVLMAAGLRGADDAPPCPAEEPAEEEPPIATPEQVQRNIAAFNAVCPEPDLGAERDAFVAGFFADYPGPIGRHDCADLLRAWDAHRSTAA